MLFRSNTPLSLAASYGHIDVVRLLLEHNADANSQDNIGYTPLHDVIRSDSFKAERTQMVQLLLKHGANPNARSRLKTPLHLASMNADLLDVSRLLLEHGADLDAKDEGGKTPLQLSLENGHDELTRLFSEYPNKPMSGSVTSM